MVIRLSSTSTLTRMVLAADGALLFVIMVVDHSSQSGGDWLVVLRFGPLGVHEGGFEFGEGDFAWTQEAPLVSIPAAFAFRRFRLGLGAQTTGATTTGAGAGAGAGAIAPPWETCSSCAIRSRSSPGGSTCSAAR